MNRWDIKRWLTENLLNPTGSAAMFGERGKEAGLSVIGERRYDYNEPPQHWAGCMAAFNNNNAFLQTELQIRILKLLPALLCPTPIDKDIFYDEERGTKRRGVSVDNDITR